MPLRETIEIHAASKAKEPAVLTANNPNGPPNPGGSTLSAQNLNSNISSSGKFLLFRIKKIISKLFQYIIF